MKIYATKETIINLDKVCFVRNYQSEIRFCFDDENNYKDISFRTIDPDTDELIPDYEKTDREFNKILKMMAE